MTSNESLAVTERDQAAASDPGNSAWVSANAGAGKTHVLKTRVLRLLLAGTAPERILCLTYTKAAAAEMEQRVFADLAGWATVADDALAERLEKVLARHPTAEERALARRLFARAIETPGGLKVQTIHAFCERLLQRFPLEAVVPPGFRILDDQTGTRLRRDAIDDVLRLATSAGSSELREALRTVVVYAQGDRFDEILTQAIAKRDWVAAASRDDGFQELADWYAATLGLGHGDDVDSLERQLAAIVDDSILRKAIVVLRGGSANDQKLAAKLTQALNATGKSRIDALTSAFLTERRPRQDSYITKKTREAEPGIAETLDAARDRFAPLLDRRDAALSRDVTLALLRLAGAVLQRYTDMKTARGMLDFDDLIRRSVNLLAGSDSAAWVLYKLDGGLDHILVDEAQDTSPEQWRIVQALAREFFAGTGTRDYARTAFAVGDEKQSIYSFQGADPAQFAEMGTYFESLAKAAGQSWRRLPLQLSFRTVAPVLEAVDRTFADPEAKKGVVSGDGRVRHFAHRAGHAGRVEIWEVEQYEAPESAPAFAPLEERNSSSAVKRLADRIARTIESWIGRENLESEGRTVRAGDIMILVRRRKPFAPAMVSALKARGIPVAGADRMVLGDHIAVRDLMALGRVLALPEDDLSLAAVLKSPLFDLNDDDLLKLAPGRPGSLYKALLKTAREDERFAAAAGSLKAWRQIADFLPPYELFTTILDNQQIRRRLLVRLGAEAADAIDEFIGLALSYDDAAPASLAGFLDTLSKTHHEVKRDLEHGRDEVRVLTVHGAKGLEAPIVFLPDTCAGVGARPETLTNLDLNRKDGAPVPAFWSVSGAGRLPALNMAKINRQQKEAEEDNRLLYVGMTRARDRLYVAGWETARPRRPTCWYDKIRTALAPSLTEVRTDDGSTVYRTDTPQTAPVTRKHDVVAADQDVAELPAWASTSPAAELRGAIPVAPSRLAPLDRDDEGEPAPFVPGSPGSPRVAKEPPTPPPAVLGADHRFLRGTITHALLEHLPNFPREGWERAAAGYVDRRAPQLSASARRSVVTEALAVLNHPSFAPVFGPGSRAEVPLVAELPDPSGRRAPLRINGQIDRMARRSEDLLIVDYKTNRPPPVDPADVPIAYLLQMAAYRLALAQLYPRVTIHAAIIWTFETRLMTLPGDTLDAIQPRLWELAGSP